jgi:hypothetical protein
MADFRNSVGYLQLKAADQARQRAITDATVNQVGQDTDIGGKALGVMQAQVQRGQHVEDLDKTLASQRASAELAGHLRLLGLKPADPEKSAAELERIKAQTAHYGRQDSHMGVSEDQGQQRIDNKVLSDAVDARLRQLGISVNAEGKYNPVSGDKTMNVDPSVFAGSGISPVPQNSDPGSFVLSKPQQNQAQEKVATSNETLRDLDDVLNVLEGRDETLKPDPSDFGGRGGGVSVLGLTPNDVQAGYGAARDLMGGITGGVVGGGPNPAMDAANRRAALGQRINMPINKILRRYGAALTETELGRGMGEAGIQQALAGKFDIYAAKLPHLISAMKYLRQKSSEEGQIAGQEAQTHRRSVSPAAPQAAAPHPPANAPRTDNPDNFFDDLVAAGMDEPTAMARTKKQFGL